MQSLTVIGDRNPNGHTPSEILDELRYRSGARRVSFRYEQWTDNGIYLGDLAGMESCSIEQNWLADIKRTARFKIRDLGVINYLSDLIKPMIRLHLPPYGDRDYVEWPQGLFLLSSPTRGTTPAGVITRDVQAYDRLQILADQKATTRYALAAGTVVTSAVSTLLGALPKSVTPSTATLPTAWERDPGTPYLTIVNDLLNSINYESLSFDEEGRAIVQPYRNPAARGEEYVYADDTNGLIVPDAEQELDLFGVPNQWSLVVSEPDRLPIVSTYTNNNPGSLTSTLRRGRTITDFRTEVEAVDQPTLDAKVARLAFESSQVYEAIPFRTALMPIHSGNDVYRITYGPLAINTKYTEQSWSMELKAGAVMQHRARRVVTI